MRRKLIAVFGAIALLAACETVDEGETGTAAGGTDIVPGSKQDFLVNVGDRVFFDYDKSNLRADAIPTLQKQVAWLKKYPQVQVFIEGHADERGTREYNLALGDRRATSVRNYYISNGIQAARIRTISYGKERPAALGHNEEAWQKNRRAVTVLWSGFK